MSENNFGLDYTGLPIRKITVGHRLKEDISYSVGMKNTRTGGVLSAITFNEFYFIKYGKAKYDIMMAMPDGQFLPWKSVVDCPVVVEYDLDAYDNAIEL